MRRLAAIAVSGLIAAGLTAGAGSSSGAGGPDGAAAAKCVKALVGGKEQCLQPGQRCKKKYEADYLLAELTCRKGRLRAASLEDQRHGEPMLIEDDGQISLKTALEVIETGVADLPGVKVRRGAVGELTDATLAFETLAAEIDELSPDQRAIYEQLTTPAPAAARRAVTAETQAELLGYVDAARRALEAHGWSFPRVISLTIHEDQGGKAGNVLAYTSARDVIGESPTCDIFMLGAGLGLSAEGRRQTLSHEVAHCAQHFYMRNITDLKNTPAWVKEGGAEWLSLVAYEHVTGSTYPTLFYRSWLREPRIDLFEREYSAVGFFSMIEQAGISPHTRYQEILTAGRTGGNEGAFKAAIAGAPQLFFDLWGAGLSRKPEFGAAWNLNGRGIIPSEPPKQLISNGTREAYSTESHAAMALELLIKSDVFIVIADKKLKGLLRGSDGKVRKLAHGAYCAKPGGCKCKTKANLSLPTIGQGSAFAGWHDVKVARAVVFEGVEIKDYCKKPVRPAPGGGKSCRTARAEDGEGGASCPLPPAGVEVYDDSGDGENLVLVATFKEAECTAGKTFTAIAEDSGYRLEVGVQDFQGFGKEYEVSYGDPDPEILLEGPGGPYGNTQSNAPGLVWAGGLSFSADGSDVGVGLVPAINAELTDARNIVGHLLCNYPPE